MLKINVNQQVRVKLTERGIEAFKDYHATLGLNQEPKLDENGYYRDTLHSVMSIFGDSVGPGAVDTPFHTEMFVEPFRPLSIQMTDEMWDKVHEAGKHTNATTEELFDVALDLLNNYITLKRCGRELCCSGGLKIELPLEIING